MTFVVYLVVYLGLGTLVAIVLTRRESSPSERVTTALLAVVAWPLWAPIASFSSRDPETHVEDDLERRIHASLDEALDAVRGSPLEALLTEQSVGAIRASVRRAAMRVAELTRTVARNEAETSQTKHRIATIEREGGGGRTLVTARVHLDNLAKLSLLLANERAALLELADLCDALRSQLVLARFAGSSVDGLADLVDELDARVEGLDSALATVVSDVRAA